MSAKTVGLEKQAPPERVLVEDTGKQRWGAQPLQDALLTDVVFVTTGSRTGMPMSGRWFLYRNRVMLGVRSVLLAGIVSAAHSAMSVMSVRERVCVVDYIQHEVIYVQRTMSPRERRHSSGDAAYVIACIQRSWRRGGSRSSQMVDRRWRQKRTLSV